MIQWLNRLSSIARLTIAFIGALALLAVSRMLQLELLADIVMSWDAFCLIMILLSWITFFTTRQSELRLEARAQDESRAVIFGIVLSSIFVSLFGLFLFMRPPEASQISRDVYRGLSIFGVLLSWILLHTVFTIRYTHLYYERFTEEQTPDDTAGLRFPTEDLPDYLDFAYFAFVVGMTFQVSDVVVTTRQFRKLVLLHGLISFVFNTAIVALSISIVSNMLH